MILEKLASKLLAKQAKLVSAESCTGGMVAATVTSVSGSSDWFERGFVTYSNLSKQEMLGVEASTLEQFGAVSEEVVREMAQGALVHSQGDYAVSITGVAGPTGGTEDKPVGTVWFGFASCASVVTKHQLFTGDRARIREQAAEYGLSGVLEILA